jgi:hypothetical protein
MAIVLLVATAALAAPIKKLPFNERLEGHLTAPPTLSSEEGRCSAPALLLSYAGEGNISHLGTVTWSSTHCTYLDEQSTGQFGEADLVVVAANGDELYGTYAGSITGPGTFEETMTITGGTGRFLGATGVVAETGSYDTVTYALEIRGHGWISYDASQRADR